jgi:hypothetical protein
VAFTLGVLGPGFLLVYAQRVLDPGWLRHMWRLPAIMIIGVGVAWSTSLAVLDALWRFVRRPKVGIGPAGGHWRGKAYTARRPWSGVAELAFGLYCGWSTWLSCAYQSYAAVPFLALYTTGFFTVGTLIAIHCMPRGDGQR